MSAFKYNVVLLDNALNETVIAQVTITLAASAIERTLTRYAKKYCRGSWKFIPESSLAGMYVSSDDVCISLTPALDW